MCLLVSKGKARTEDKGYEELAWLCCILFGFGFKWVHCCWSFILKMAETLNQASMAQGPLFKLNVLLKKQTVLLNTCSYSYRKINTVNTLFYSVKHSKTTIFLGTSTGKTMVFQCFVPSMFLIQTSQAVQFVGHSTRFGDIGNLCWTLSTEQMETFRVLKKRPYKVEHLWYLKKP